MPALTCQLTYRDAWGRRGLDSRVRGKRRAHARSAQVRGRSGSSAQADRCHADPYRLSHTAQRAWRPSACSSWKTCCTWSTARAGRAGGRRGRGSAGRSSGQRCSRRTLGARVRMRFICSPTASCAGRPRVARAAFGDHFARALAALGTPHRPPHEPSAFARPRPPGDRRTPARPAQRTPGRRKHVRPRRWPPGPEVRWARRSAAGSTRTRRRPGPCWSRDGTSLAASSAPFRRSPPHLRH